MTDDTWLNAALVVFLGLPQLVNAGKNTSFLSVFHGKCLSDLVHFFLCLSVCLSLSVCLFCF